MGKKAAGSPLIGALFGATQQRVLALLFGQPGRSFFTKELIDLAGGGSGAVQRELGRLQQGGLILRENVGNQKHYRANPNSPIFAELTGIVAKTLGPAEVLRAALAAISDKIQLALLYGSVAAGRDTARSDFDLLLVADDLTLEEVYQALHPAEMRLGRPVNPILYNRAELQKRVQQRNPFLHKVLAGKIVTLMGDMDAVTATGQSGSRRPAQG